MQVEKKHATVTFYIVVWPALSSPAWNILMCLWKAFALQTSSMAKQHWNAKNVALQAFINAKQYWNAYFKSTRNIYLSLFFAFKIEVWNIALLLLWRFAPLYIFNFKFQLYCYCICFILWLSYLESLTF